MTIVNYENLKPAELIAQYIVECRDRTSQLSYMDYDIIDEWLASASSLDDLLLVLSEIIPAHFTKNQEKSFATTLKGVRKKVLKRLKFQAQRHNLRVAAAEG